MGLRLRACFGLLRVYSGLSGFVRVYSVRLSSGLTSLGFVFRDFTYRGFWFVVFSGFGV